MAVRFERVELRYGRHSGSFVLVSGGAAGDGGGNGATNGSTPGRPFVVLGPNGSGKSTLVEAPVRTLFGFRRNRKDGREAFHSREPWTGGPYRALVVVRTPGGRFTFERDFETDRIRVTEEGREAPIFDAEANPAREGESIRRYREILRDVIGLDSIDHYRDTACVFQGDLLATGLSVDLLRVAAGGHTDVESAQRRLRDEYVRMTVEPIAPGASRRRKPGELERLEKEVEELEARAARARAAEERRRPLVTQREALVETVERLGEETTRLEAAFETLSEGRRVETEIEAARARVRALESAEQDLDEALAGFNMVRARGDAHESRYPEDFAERARALEEGLWPRLEAIEAESGRLASAADAGSFGSSRALLIGSLVLAVGAVGLTLAGRTIVGLLGILVGAGTAAAAWVRARALRDREADRAERLSELETERTELTARIARLTGDVPDGAVLRPETLPGARREFEREVADRRLLDESEGSLRQAMDAAARTVRLHAAEDGDGSDTAVPPADSGPLTERARDRLNALQGAISRERDDELAPRRLRLNEIARARFDLPEDVEPDLEAVRAGRRERLERARAARDELNAVEGELGAEGGASDSALALERELSERRSAAEGLAARAAAYRSAHALLTEAYDAFRETDETRLLEAISEHLQALSGDALGPVEAADGLDAAEVRAGDRGLPISSPPLSYGQLHAALLSIRMGAADFLAGLGVAPPLIIDDPFVHLDERRAADVWEVLRRISERRQVIVATQDRLVLEHMGVTPDLVLGAPEETAPDPPASNRVEEPNRVEDELLDLWGDADA